jgi:dTDP-4-dehydrorhamnose reductase
MAAPRVLLIGGHGKVAMHMTPLMLAKSWNVTSVIRDPSHKDEILKLAEGPEGQKGKLEVLISSVEDVKSDEDAKKVLDEAKPNYVVWSAGRS